MSEPNFKPLHISKGFQSFYFVFDEDNRTVADFQHCTLSKEAQDVYANLFAAAPEMYEMLASIRTTLKYMGYLPYLVKDIDLILRKAREESEVSK